MNLRPLFLVLLAAFLACGGLLAERPTIAQMELADGKTLHNVRLLSVGTESVIVRHDSGIVNIAVKALPEEARELWEIVIPEEPERIADSDEGGDSADVGAVDAETAVPPVPEILLGPPAERVEAVVPEDEREPGTSVEEVADTEAEAESEIAPVAEVLDNETETDNETLSDPAEGAPAGNDTLLRRARGERQRGAPPGQCRGMTPF